MRLAWKIFVASALVVLVLVGVAAVSLLAMNRLVTVNRDIATRSVPALKMENSARDSLDRLARLEARYMIRNDRAYVEAWAERADQVAADLDRLGPFLTTTDEREARAVAAGAFAAYRRHFDAAQGLMAHGHPDRARRVSEGPGRQAMQITESSLERLLGATEAALARSQVEAGALEGRTRTAVVTALAASLLAALGASALLAHRMTRSLRRLSAATTELAESGVVTAPLPVDRQDEIGDLARSFNRMADRLQDVERQKQESFSHISHDLRNPLTAIQAAAQVLLSRARGPLEPPQANLVQIIGDCSHRMLGLINQILEFTRLRAQAVTIERKVVDLAKLAAHALDEAQAQAEQAGLVVESIVDGSDFEVEGDEDGLMRVVGNLVGNAIKFTPRGGSVKVLLADAGERLELSVEDTGLGIPADALPRIFDPYRRAHHGPKGSGLGLAVVKGLVEAHGGRIEVESEEGKGSCFTVSLPRTRRAA